MPETPQKENSKENLAHSQMIEDPRSPSMYHQRTPIVLQDYEESPQNVALRAEFPDPRSPSVKISRTPLPFPSRSVVVVDEKDGEVFESRGRSTSDPPTPNSKQEAEPEVNSPGAPLTRKDKASLLKSTASPSDYKRRNRLRRRQSLPQKLFSDKSATIPRSPLAQRNHSVPEGGKSKFTILPKKKGFLSEDFNDDKENTNLPIIQ